MGAGFGISIDVTSNWSSLLCGGVTSDHPWPWLPPHSAFPGKSSWSSSPNSFMFDVHPALFRVCPHFCFTAIPNVERNWERTIVSHWKVHVSQAPFLSFFSIKREKKTINDRLLQFEKLSESESTSCCTAVFVTQWAPSLAKETDPVDLNRPWEVLWGWGCLVVFAAGTTKGTTHLCQNRDCEHSKDIQKLHWRIRQRWSQTPVLTPTWYKTFRNVVSFCVSGSFTGTTSAVPPHQGVAERARAFKAQSFPQMFLFKSSSYRWQEGGIIQCFTQGLKLI